jgi:hypothetical protein
MARASASPIFAGQIWADDREQIPLTREEAQGSRLTRARSLILLPGLRRILFAGAAAFYRSTVFGDDPYNCGSNASTVAIKAANCCVSLPPHLLSCGASSAAPADNAAGDSDEVPAYLGPAPGEACRIFGPGRLPFKGKRGTALAPSPSVLPG